MAGPCTAIVAPPPTPNGDLHVGHLSGPYLGADVLRRYLEMNGERVVTALSVDLNQTYVVTTAERLRIDPAALARKSHRDVAATLAAADLAFDVVGMPDAAYADYVADWFARFHAAGLIERRRRAIPFAPAANRFLFESYASGWCPTCLAETRANICETCGHPNEACDLLGLYPTGWRPDSTVESREVAEYVLALEPWRDALAAKLLAPTLERRPAVDRLIAELFARPLPAFPLTFPSRWGIPAPFPDADGLVLNVWAEMVPGHYYWLNAADAAKGGTGPLVTREQTARYVQCLGFDNSFFYVVAHLALALAARAAGIESLVPDAFVTNEFYLLDNFKFSTSQGHLIWGRDFLAERSVDEARFFLAWTNPEYNQANFSLDDFERVVAPKFREPFARLIEALAAPTHLGSPAESPYSEALAARFDAAYAPRRPSLRIAALTIANGLSLATEQILRGERPGVISGVVHALARGMAPIAPDASRRLARAAREASEPGRMPETRRRRSVSM
jgi:methionyl-tRNA synthetase